MRYLLVLVLTLGGCAVNTGIVEIGSETFMVSRQAATGFTGKGNLKEESLSEATVFCKKQKKSVKIISVVEAQPPYILGNFPKAEVQFACIDSEKTDKVIKSVSNRSKPLNSKQGSLDASRARKFAFERDAVAIIIGIQDYKRVPRADFANNDAKEFYEYAVRALGVKPEKIKILLDEEADDVNILKAFENWLPIQVNRDKTDVYVFFSGHGLPAPDGKSLYFLPYGVDKELLSRTAVAQNEVVAALSAAKPRSVTMFIDACYSGQTRAGDVLVTNAKPLALKSDASNYPSNFTVITASANDQISSSSPELKHGIFSFYLMKGMEGEADANQDGKITVGEMQDYLSDKVSRQAMTLNRKQSPQLVGDTSRVLIER